MASSVPASRSQQAPPSSSSTATPATGLGTAPPPEKSSFETQRAALIGEIGISMEHVLANINKLNRSLEGVIAVGNEFGSVEALWSQFENVMAKDATTAVAGAEGGAESAGAGAGGPGSEKGHGHDDEDD